MVRACEGETGEEEEENRPRLGRVLCDRLLSGVEGDKENKRLFTTMSVLGKS